MRPVVESPQRPRHRGSSPSSRRGSIAARASGDPASQCAASSSPSSRRGSIAAPSPSPRCSEPTGRPRRHDGAPLRPRDGRLWGHAAAGVVPVVTTGLHCGHGCLAHAAVCEQVVPVVTTGLHCGTTCRWARTTFAPWSSPSSRRGSIAAPCLSVRTRCIASSSPSSRRGSIAAGGGCPRGGVRSVSSPSSRRGSIAACRCGPPRQPPRVVPVVTTGLHCGFQLTIPPVEAQFVVPVVTTGLHCGTKYERGFPSFPRRPRRHDGAPLRPWRRWPGTRSRRGTSSPSSRRGSIAARDTG